MVRLPKLEPNDERSHAGGETVNRVAELAGNAQLRVDGVF